MMSNEQEYNLEADSCQPTNCVQLRAHFYGVCPICQLESSKDALCTNKENKNMSFKEEALHELSEINQFMGFSKAVYANTQVYINEQASEHENMKVCALVDMCLDLTRLDRNEVCK